MRGCAGQAYGRRSELQVAGSLAAVGVMAQVRLTVPVNPLAPGVTVMVEVLPLVAPGLTEMLPPLLREKVLAAADTVT